MAGIQILSEQKLQEIKEVNEILKELIPFDEKLKKYGLRLELVEVKPKNRFQEKLEQMMSDNAKVQ